MSSFPDPTGQKPRYRSLVSAGFVSVLAWIMLITGAFMGTLCIISAILGASSKYGANAAIVAVSWGLVAIALGLIITSAFLFVIANMSSDIHLLTYTVDQLARSNDEKQNYILWHLQTIEERLENGKDDYGENSQQNDTVKPAPPAKAYQSQDESLSGAYNQPDISRVEVYKRPARQADLLSSPKSVQWYYRGPDGVASGPFSYDDVLDDFNHNDIDARFEVRPANSDEWMPISSSVFLKRK